MTRYNFRTGIPYAAKLTKVTTRPIENDPAMEIALIRLEFAIYWIYGQRLESQGEIACRDLVVGRIIPSNRDVGLLAYAQALRISGLPENPISWLSLQKLERWIEITFGPREQEGLRNPFITIRPFSPEGREIKEYRYDRTACWVSIAEAADAVQTSLSTARRRLQVLEQIWGSEVVTRTDGRHRRVNLPLFVALWEE